MTNATTQAEANLYTTRAGKATHVLSYDNAAQGSRAPACGQSRSIRGGGYMRFAGVGAPTCEHCQEIVAERVAATGSPKRLYDFSK